MNKISQEDWNNIIQMMKEEYEISTAPFNSWIKPLTVHSVNDHTVNIMLSDGLSQMKGYISKKYLQQFAVTISEYFEDEYDVVIGTSKDFDHLLPDNGDNSHDKKNEHAVLNKTLNPKYTFETFVVGKNNELAHATALAVATDPGDYGNPLFIYGGVGLGKTHLMQSIAHYILSYDPDFKIIYTTTENFSAELYKSIKTKTQEAFKEKYRNIDMLLIDDIQFIADKDSTMEEFFHTFNSLYDNKKQIVISSDKPPKDIVGIEDRLISRFKAGLTVDVKPPDYDTRLAILDRHAESENLNIEDKALYYIAENIVSNIRELEGAINSIVNYTRLKKTDYVDLEIAKEALKDIIEPEKDKPVTPEMIMNTVIEQFDYKITLDDIKGQNKSRKIAYPRQICMYLCSTYTDLSQEAIGSALGNRDHTTILYGKRKIESDMETDERLRNMISVITKKLNLTR